MQPSDSLAMRRSIGRRSACRSQPGHGPVSGSAFSPPSGPRKPRGRPARDPRCDLWGTTDPRGTDSGPPGVVWGWRGACCGPSSQPAVARCMIGACRRRAGAAAPAVIPAGRDMRRAERRRRRCHGARYPEPDWIARGARRASSKSRPSKAVECPGVIFTADARLRTNSLGNPAPTWGIALSPRSRPPSVSPTARMALQWMALAQTAKTEFHEEVRCGSTVGGNRRWALIEKIGETVDCTPWPLSGPG